MEKLKTKLNFISTENIVEKFENISTVCKYAFVFSLIFFVIVHFGFFSDRLVNEDSRHFLTGWNLISNPILGRILGNILTNYLNPWTLGTISAVYLALTGMITVSLLSFTIT